MVEFTWSLQAVEVALVVRTPRQLVPVVVVALSMAAMRGDQKPVQEAEVVLVVAVAEPVLEVPQARARLREIARKQLGMRREVLRIPETLARGRPEVTAI
jgi:hypothetical protein